MGKETYSKLHSLFDDKEDVINLGSSEEEGFLPKETQPNPKLRPTFVLTSFAIVLIWALSIAGTWHLALRARLPPPNINFGNTFDTELSKYNVRSMIFAVTFISFPRFNAVRYRDKKSSYQWHSRVGQQWHHI